MDRQTLEFFKAALRHPLSVSTVFPTSAALADQLLLAAQVQKADRIVELGAGTGAITTRLAMQLSDPAKYLGIELDPKMVEILKSGFPTFKFQAGYASQITEWVEKGSIDSVVSSLPWSLLPQKVQDDTLDGILAALKPGGTFATYLCVNTFLLPFSRAFRQRIKSRFSHVSVETLEWKNIPPAMVYRAIK